MCSNVQGIWEEKGSLKFNERKEFQENKEWISQKQKLQYTAIVLKSTGNAKDLKTLLLRDSETIHKNWWTDRIKSFSWTEIKS